MVWSRFDLGWPWAGLGAALALLATMFWTNSMRSRSTGSRWWDPVWLSWLVAPMYMLHQFEEYACDVLGRANLIQENVCHAQGYAPYPDCPIPTAHYPFVNIALAWVAAPLAAWLCRRNPVTGLTFYGFVIFNGILHVVTALTGGRDALPGVVTGVLLFIPSFFWTVYVCLKSGVMTRKALAVSLSGGVAGHVCLGAAYALFKAGIVGAPGMLVFDALTVFLPILVAGAGSRIWGLTATTPTKALAA